MINQGDEYQFSEAHYRIAMEASNIGMWDWDLLQDTYVWTKRCKAIFGLRLEDEVSYGLFLTLVHPDDLEYVQNLFTESLNNRTNHPAEYRIIWPDGSLHWIYARGQATYNDEGRPVRLIGIALDVTARKEAEEAQRRADRRISEILESVDEAFIHLDAEWRFTYINSRATHIGGYIPAGEIIGRNFWELYSGLKKTATYHYFHQVMETRQPVTYEIYYSHIQSWYDIRAYPADDGGITIFLTNITERKILEQERDRLLEQERAARVEAESARRHSDELVIHLEHKQALLQAIMKQTPAGLMIAEAPRGDLIFCSEETYRLLGDEIPGYENYLAYVRSRGRHADGTSYRVEEYPMMRALLKGEVVMQEDMLYHRDDDTYLHLSISAAPIHDDQGNMLAAVVTFNDVSERYELERKKDEFISMASHELRTPLTSIKGNLQLSQRRLRHLLEGSDAPLVAEGRATVDHLTQLNERALRQVNVETRLVNDLLDASRIQTQGLRVSLSSSNLVQIVRDAVNDMQAVTSTRTIYLEIPDESVITVLADSIRIGQVITNYLTNALKYSTEDKSVTVGLSLTGREACVWVKDAGPGIPQEVQRSIWDRFRQVGSFVDYTRLGGGGLGLGLYINHALIQLHGGHSGVESKADEGSTFWFTLPLVNNCPGISP